MKLAPPASLKTVATPAHPLFPPDQALLWLPGLPGPELPFCSYNDARGIPGSESERRYQQEFLHDGEGNLFSPPYPISPRTFISWHTHVSPPFPYHPVPLKRFLSIAEMELLARQVMEITGQTPAANSHLLGVLSNEHKTFILVFLSRMGVLADAIAHWK